MFKTYGDKIVSKLEQEEMLREQLLLLKEIKQSGFDLPNRKNISELNLKQKFSMQSML